MPFILMSGLVLGACGNNGDIPKDNETPMEDLNDREKSMTPDVREEHRSGAELDGLDPEQNPTGNGRDGVIHDDEMNDNTNDMLEDENNLNDKSNEPNNR